MFRNRTVFASILTAVFVAVSAMPAPAKDADAVLVIPARFRVVSLGQDICRVHNVRLVSYQEKSPAGRLVMHEWAGGKWTAVNPDDLAGMKRISESIVVGDDAMVPGAIWDCTKELGELWRIKTTSITELVDRLSRILKLSTRDLEWLAPRHGLKLSDRNAERRRYGKYGKDDKATQAPDEGAAPEAAVMPPAEPVEPAPEPAIEEPAAPAPAEPIPAAPAVKNESAPAIEDEPLIPEEPVLEPVQDEDAPEPEKGMLEK